MSLRYFPDEVRLPYSTELQGQSHYFVIHNGSNVRKSIATDGTCGPLCGSLSAYPVANKTFNITAVIANYIIGCLEVCDVSLGYSTEINIQASIEWSSNYSLSLISQKSITLARGVSIYNNGAGTLKLMSGMENQNGVGTVTFEEGSTVSVPNCGKVEIYYNPEKGEQQHKYLNPGRYRNSVSPTKALYTYMLVNNIDDLRHIMLNPSKSYALSQNIDHVGQAWIPLYVYSRETAFSGSFEGNNYILSNFVINRPEDDVGLFKALTGSEIVHPCIRNLVLENFNCHGLNRVGGIAGTVSHYDFENIALRDIQVSGTNFVGGIAGSIGYGNITLFSYTNLELDASVDDAKCVGNLTGATEGVSYDGNHCVY